MAQFIPFQENIEVNSDAIISFVESTKRGQKKRLEILKKHGIIPMNGGWYPQQKWLDALKELHDDIGEMNLLLIGMAIIDNAKFPPINSIKESLEILDTAYHMNHRYTDGTPLFNPATGEKKEGIGFYELKMYSETERKAIIFCKNPYPSKFDEGILTALCRKFNPDQFKQIKVKADPFKERRATGGDSCTFIIKW